MKSTLCFKLIFVCRSAKNVANNTCNGDCIDSGHCQSCDPNTLTLFRRLSLLDCQDMPYHDHTYDIRGSTLKPAMSVLSDMTDVEELDLSYLNIVSISLSSQPFIALDCRGVSFQRRS